MRITIYELLGLVKDGKAPKKLIYDGVEFVYGAFTNEGDFLEGLDGKSYNGEKSGYWCKEQNGWFEYYVDFYSLNDTVEIPKEENKIEKLKWNEKSQHNVVTDNTKKTLEHLLSRSEQLKKCLNKVIDEINKLKEDK